MKKRKGISPLISAVLLIVIAVSISALIFTWAGGFVKSAQTTVSNRTGESVECSGASISIQDVYLTNGTSGSARAVVKNEGLTDSLTITSGQLFNRTGGNFTANNTPISGFNTGDVAVVIFRNISVEKCSDLSQVIVTSNCGGVSDTFLVRNKAPIC